MGRRLVLVVALPLVGEGRMRVQPKVPAAPQRADGTDKVVGVKAARSNEADGVGNEAAWSLRLPAKEPCQYCQGREGDLLKY